MLDLETQITGRYKLLEKLESQQAITNGQISSCKNDSELPVLMKLLTITTKQIKSLKKDIAKLEEANS